MNHDHTNATPCPPCVTANGQGDDKAFGEKLRTFLGVCGCLSCYAAMFPAILLGIVGVVGLSTSQTLNALNAYTQSILFQPILVVSILFFISSLFGYGKIPLILSVIAGFGIFTSMSLYMTEWLFTVSFGLLAIAYYLAFQQTKAHPLKVALVLLIAVVTLGVIDIGRAVFSSPPPSGSTPPAGTPQHIMDMIR